MFESSCLDYCSFSFLFRYPLLCSALALKAPITALLSAYVTMDLACCTRCLGKRLAWRVQIELNAMLCAMKCDYLFSGASGRLLKTTHCLTHVSEAFLNQLRRAPYYTLTLRRAMGSFTCVVRRRFLPCNPYSAKYASGPRSHMP